MPMKFKGEWCAVSSHCQVQRFKMHHTVAMGTSMGGDLGREGDFGLVFARF